jgi:hypothetical protein
MTQTPLMKPAAPLITLTLKADRIAGLLFFMFHSPLPIFNQALDDRVVLEQEQS